MNQCTDVYKTESLLFRIVRAIEGGKVPYGVSRPTSRNCCFVQAIEITLDWAYGKVLPTRATFMYGSGSHRLRAGHAPADASYQEVDVTCTLLGEGRHPPRSRAPRSRGVLHRDDGLAPCTMCPAGCRA